MKIKKIIRRLGFDLVKYHSRFENLLKKYSIESVIDVGANEGQFARHIHTIIPAAKIYSFEPLKEPFKKLKALKDSIPDFECFNTALGNTTTKINIWKSSFSPSSSMLPMEQLHKNIYPKSAELTKESVDLDKLDNFKSKLNISGKYLVKIDVQGFEKEVIAGGSEIIGKATLLLVETSFVSLYSNQPLFDEIAEQLFNLGFRYFGHDGQHWNEKNEDLLFQDSIFINQSSLLK
jgi:FkbM family methyltransferase